MVLLPKGGESSDSRGNPHSMKFVVEAITQEVEEVSEYFEDKPKPQHNELLEVNLAEEGSPPKPIYINKELTF